MRHVADLVVARTRAVIAFWVALMVLAGFGAAKLQDELTNGGYGVSGSQSLAARNILSGGGSRPVTTEVFAALFVDRPNEAALRTAAARVADRARVLPYVARVGAVRLSDRRTVGVLPIWLREGLPQAQKKVGDLSSAANAASDVRVVIVGEAAVQYRYTEVARKDLSRSEFIAFPVIFGVLLVAFLSVVASVFPLALAVVCLLVIWGALFLLAQAMNMSIFVTNITFSLSLGLSIDFCLFIVIRFREQLEAGASGANAVRFSLETSGRAILFSSLTVGASLGCMALVGLGVFTSMAIGASLATAIAASAALTLVPAALLLLGPRINRLTLPIASRAAASGAVWHRVADLVLRRRWVILITTVLFLAVCSIGVAATKTSFRTTSVLPKSDPVHSAIDRIGKAMGPGTLSPVTIITRDDPTVVQEKLQKVHGVAHVSPVVPVGRAFVASEAFLATQPDTDAGERIVRNIRDALATSRLTYVGGRTAEAIDLENRLHKRSPLVVVAACLVALFLLLAAFRYPVIAAKAIITTLLSVGAALGLTVLVFQGLLNEPGLAYYVPLFLFTIIFGLATDYEVFFISRVREEYLRGRSNEDAIREGILRSSRAITLAGLIMVIVFVSFMASSLKPYQELGFGMAVAVIFDITVTRALLVPAALAVFGRRNWWSPF